MAAGPWLQVVGGTDRCEEQLETPPARIAFECPQPRGGSRKPSNACVPEYRIREAKVDQQLSEHNAAPILWNLYCRKSLGTENRCGQTDASISQQHSGGDLKQQLSNMYDSDCSGNPRIQGETLLAQCGSCERTASDHQQVRRASGTAEPAFQSITHALDPQTLEINIGNQMPLAHGRHLHLVLLVSLPAVSDQLAVATPSGQAQGQGCGSKKSRSWKMAIFSDTTRKAKVDPLATQPVYARLGSSASPLAGRMAPGVQSLRIASSRCRRRFNALKLRR
ncbi:uncharacterized protein MYCGRDRAFT_97881 [Zymoseptoria tritici IPO323]|uniref:Uncharacterized protein n=1 Tax=Zymoseptoria tritici (strain CBS 115943 / IPO323) TaxID=336722 RepID=F9XRN6_ZYMTI|nr:uncharacterized protein MYCGRDRAFT_97881 [Zymoseptoria tritici IPO323]EGP82065.1 hypothetical protein MYCGRDRAFT_97881 [Zymoseptoria tritici IPO323]